MPVRGDNSLYFATGMDNSGLRSGAGDALGIIGNLSSQIARINPFAALAVAGAAAMATIGASAYKMAREFEQAMKEVETISKATQENFKGISSEVFALSKISPDDPTKLAKAYYQIVSAGYDGAKGLKLLETAAKAATAGVTTTETAADGITTVLNAFKLEAEDADEVADALFQTVKLGKTNFEQLSNTLSQVAPLAAASGYSFREVLAAVASLTKQGVPTAQAMTQIRSAIEATTEVLGDGAAKSMTLQNAFQAVYDKAGGSQNQLKELTGRMEAMNAILAVAGPNAEGAAKDLEELGNSAGEAEKAFSRMAGSNVNEWKILGNRVKATTEEIGNSLVELSSGIARYFNEALDDSDKLKESYDEQRTELFKLKGAVESVNEDSEEFKQLRKQIIEQYPEFISGIDQEKASTEDLLGVLNQVNDAYLQRYKFAKRQEEVKKELQEQGNIEIKIEDAEIKFKDQLANLERIAEDRGVALNIDYSKGLNDIYKDVKKQLDEAGQIFSGEGMYYESAFQQDFNRLTAANRAILDLTDAYKEQRNVVEDLTDRNRKLTKAELQTTAGRVEAIKQINKAMKESDLAEFVGSGVDEIDKAIESRRKIIEDFQSIDQAKNLESLKPFLDSELEEIRKYAKERQRYLNNEVTGGDTGTDLETYRKFLKDKEQAYKEYEVAVRQLGKETADTQYQSLLDQGENYGEYLKDQLEKTKDYGRQQAIALAAESYGTRLNREKVTSVNSGLNAGTVNFDYKIDQSSIRFMERQLKLLTEKFEKATAENRPEIKKMIDYWEKRIKLARGGTDEEKSLYEDVTRELSTMTYKSLKEYIKYWQDRLKIANLSAEQEQEIEGKIADGQRALWRKRIDDIVSSLDGASEILRNVGEDGVADLIDGLRGAAVELDNLFTVLDENTSTEGKITAGIQAAINLTSMLISSAAERRKAEEDFYNSVIAQQKQYNRLLNEQLLIREGINENVFTTDYITQLENGLDALQGANENFRDSLEALREGEVQVGTRNVVDAGNILSGAGQGAVLGAAIGSVVPVIGNVVGAIGGAIIGGLTGLFGGRSSSPEYTDLLREYPELIQTAENGQREFNTALAQTLLDQELVNEATRTLIEDTIAWQEQIEAAREQIKGVISDLAGSLGTDLRDALVDAFQSGADSAEAMGDTISNVLQNILEQLIFDKIFSEQFKRLEEQMAASFDTGGDRTWIDDFTRFFNESQELTDQFNQALEDARDIAGQSGFDIFGDTSQQREGLSGAISSITEDTANILEGYMNAIRLDVRASLTINQQSLQYQSEIANNTRYNRFLESIDGRFANIENQILEFQAQG